METKQILIALLSNADPDKLDEMCYNTPCVGVKCSECPLYSTQNAQVAAKELSECQLS